MKSIRVVENWQMIVRSCPYCKAKEGVYCADKNSNVGAGWGWSCSKCNKTSPLMIRRN